MTTTFCEIVRVRSERSTFLAASNVAIAKKVLPSTSSI